MKHHIQYFLLLSSICLVSQSAKSSDTLTEVNQAQLAFLAEMFQIKEEVLTDFVQSYDFKCPQALSHQDLVNILSMDEEETELSVMQESEKLGWRDIYVEARSNIECIHEGLVSNAY